MSSQLSCRVVDGDIGGRYKLLTIVKRYRQKKERFENFDPTVAPEVRIYKAVYRGVFILVKDVLVYIITV